MDETQALAFIEGQRWTFAKTMPQHPHEYIVRGKGNTDDEFDALVRFIRKNGEPRGWGGKTYLQWYGPDGHHYWTMGWPVAQTTIINRAVSSIDTTYDAQLGDPWSGPRDERPEA